MLLYQQEMKLKGVLLDALDQEASTASIRVNFFDEDEITLPRIPNASTLMFVIDPKNKQGKTELILATAHTTTDGITTLTDVTRGISRGGTYAVTGSATVAQKWTENITEIGVATEHINNNTLRALHAGTIGTGADIWRVGAGTDTDITIYAQNADTNKPFLRYDADANTTGAWVVSHDGVNTTVIDGAGGVFTATAPIDITASVVSLTLNATPALEVSTGLRVKTRSDTAGTLTGGTSATAIVATWTAVSDGSFTISIDGLEQDITGVDFSSGVTTMAHVAGKIEDALQAIALGGFTAATCTWDTDHFIITSGLSGSFSSVSVTSAVGSGTDISGVGATTFMDCDTGNGTPATGVSGGLTRHVDGLYISSVSWEDITGLDLNNIEELNSLKGVDITYVTGANLTKLVNGSNADTLHIHTGVLIGTPQDLSLSWANNTDGASGSKTATITIPSGKVANIIKITCRVRVYDSSVAANDWTSTLIYDGTSFINQLWHDITGGTTGFGTSSTLSFTSGSVSQTVSVTSITGGDGNDVIITLTWTGGASNDNGTVQGIVEVYA